MTGGGVDDSGSRGDKNPGDARQNQVSWGVGNITIEKCTEIVARLYETEWDSWQAARAATEFVLALPCPFCLASMPKDDAEAVRNLGRRVEAWLNENVKLAPFDAEAFHLAVPMFIGAIREQLGDLDQRRQGHPDGRQGEHLDGPGQTGPGGCEVINLVSRLKGIGASGDTPEGT